MTVFRVELLMKAALWNRPTYPLKSATPNERWRVVAVLSDRCAARPRRPRAARSRRWFWQEFLYCSRPCALATCTLSQQVFSVRTWKQQSKTRHIVCSSPFWLFL